jgi:broad specificity phosphatase PhoE
MLVYLIRHGQTDYNAEGRIQGWLEVPLNAEGRIQADKLARRLASKPISTVYASPLSRAADTGRAIAEARKAPLIIDERLREYHMGEWGGKTVAELSADFNALEHGDAEIHPPGGETAQQMRERVDAFLRDALERHTEHDDRIAVVSHGGTLGSMIGAMLKMSAARRHPFAFGNSSISEAIWSHGRWRLVSLNDRHHLVME